MKLRLILASFVLVAGLLPAQSTPTEIFETLSKSIDAGRRLRIEKAKAKAEIERMHAEQKLLEEQASKTAVEAERLKRETATVAIGDQLQEQQTPSSQADRAVVIFLATDAMSKVAIRYPDFGDYRLRIVRLARSLLPSETITPEQYVESLYLVAKYSSFAVDLPPK